LREHTIGREIIRDRAERRAESRWRMWSLMKKYYERALMRRSCAVAFPRAESTDPNRNPAFRDAAGKHSADDDTRPNSEGSRMQMGSFRSCHIVRVWNKQCIQEQLSCNYAYYRQCCNNGRLPSRSRWLKKLNLEHKLLGVQINFLLSFLPISRTASNQVRYPHRSFRVIFKC
jgi:hypothetical protein